ncbi:MAG TPA: hypothetical protein VHL08_10380 [Dongiaceae bacterium]|jgi:hypothetical protein|nr:hypothetical protein [Dongiaceae bacterium]
MYYYHWGYHWGLLSLLALLIPMAVIIGKAGFSKWWILVAFIPVINIIFFWIFAFADWPNARRS